jgi:hypothetical protein
MLEPVSERQKASDRGVQAFDKLGGLLSRCKVLYDKQRETYPSMTVQDFFQQVAEAVDMSKKVIELLPVGNYIRYAPGKGLATVPVEVMGIIVSSTAEVIPDVFVVTLNVFDDGERLYKTELLRDFLRPRSNGGSRRESSYWPRIQANGRRRAIGDSDTRSFLASAMNR